MLPQLFRQFEALAPLKSLMETADSNTPKCPFYIEYLLKTAMLNYVNLKTRIHKKIKKLLR